MAQGSFTSLLNHFYTKKLTKNHLDEENSEENNCAAQIENLKYV